MKDRTFLIDNENYRTAEERLYGYIITQDGDVLIDELPDAASDTGHFVMVTKEDGDLVIRQDFCGSFGLFLRHKRGRFCLSNSFFRLVEYLGTAAHPDRLAIRTLVSANEVPLIHSRTMVRSIRKLDSADTVRINLETGKLCIVKKEYTYYKRTLKTREDFEALDAWYFKWVRIIRRLAERGVPLTTDLSGGLDTRLILSMLLSASLDPDSCLRINTHTKKNLDKDTDDYRIAKEIAAAFGFSLNSDQALKEEEFSDPDHPLTAADAYHAGLYTSFGCSNLVKYLMKEYDQPVFCLKGLGSTTKGGFDNSPRSIVVSNREKALNCYSGEFPRLAGRIHYNWLKLFYDRWFTRQARQLLSGYDHLPSHQATLLYKKCQIENRDATKALDWMNSNMFVISPFIDPALSQFDYDPADSDILWFNTVLLDRYAPDLLKFEVQGRHFSETSLREARELNRQFPVQKPSFPTLRGKQVTVRKRTLPREVFSAGLEHLWADRVFLSSCRKYLMPATIREILSKADAMKMNLRPQAVNSLMAIYELEGIRNGRKRNSNI